jgi:hypothetical protein
MKTNTIKKHGQWLTELKFLGISYIAKELLGKYQHHLPKIPSDLPISEGVLVSSEGNSRTVPRNPTNKLLISDKDPIFKDLQASLERQQSLLQTRPEHKLPIFYSPHQKNTTSPISLTDMVYSDIFGFITSRLHNAKWDITQITQNFELTYQPKSWLAWWENRPQGPDTHPEYRQYKYTHEAHLIQRYKHEEQWELENIKLTIFNITSLANGMLAHYIRQKDRKYKYRRRWTQRIPQRIT